MIPAVESDTSSVQTHTVEHLSAKQPDTSQGTSLVYTDIIIIHIKEERKETQLLSP